MRLQRIVLVDPTRLVPAAALQALQGIAEEGRTPRGAGVLLGDLAGARVVPSCSSSSAGRGTSALAAALNVSMREERVGSRNVDKEGRKRVDKEGRKTWDEGT